MEDTQVQPIDPQDSPIVEGPGGAESSVDSEIEALLRHAEALTEVITSNTAGPLDDYLESIADAGPIEAKPRPPVVERPPPVLPGRSEPRAVESTERQPEPAAPDRQDAPESSVVNESDAFTGDPADTSDIDAALAGGDSGEAAPQTDEQTAEIDAILQDAGNAPAFADNTEDSPRDLPDLLNDPDETAPRDSASIEAATPAEPSVEVLYIPDEETAEDMDPPDMSEVAQKVEPAPEDIDAPPPPTAAHDVEPVEEVAVSTPERSKEALDAPRPRASQKALRMLSVTIAASRTALQFTTRVPAMVIAVIGYALAIVNKPFARTSPRTRDIIGIIGIATLICGILAWVLPWLLTSNPFLKIPTGIVTRN